MASPLICVWCRRRPVYTGSQFCSRSHRDEAQAAELLALMAATQLRGDDGGGNGYYGNGGHPYQSQHWGPPTRPRAMCITCGLYPPNPNFPGSPFCSAHCRDGNPSPPPPPPTRHHHQNFYPVPSDDGVRRRKCVVCDDDFAFPGSMFCGQTCMAIAAALQTSFPTSGSGTSGRGRGRGRGGYGSWVGHRGRGYPISTVPTPNPFSCTDASGKTRHVCINPTCIRPVFVSADGGESLFCGGKHKSEDAKRKPTSLSDPSVLIMTTMGTALHLYPNVSTKFVKMHTKIERKLQEHYAIKRAMILSMLDANVHASMKTHSFKDFYIDCILRLEIQTRWAQCLQLKAAPNGPKLLYLFHGTSRFGAQRIEKGLFVLSQNGHFGPGIYLAANSTAAHLFAMDKVLCPTCTPAPYNGTTAPPFMKFEGPTNATPNVNCGNCPQTGIAKNGLHRCQGCQKVLCRACGDKFVNGDGYCYMLLCIVNVGDVKNINAKPTGPMTCDTYKATNTRGWTEYIVKDCHRVYPCYRIRYKTDTAFANSPPPAAKPANATPN